MLNNLPMPQDLLSVNDARVAQLRREMEVLRAHRSSRPVRRWLGRLLVRLGRRLAAEPSLRPARSH